MIWPEAYPDETLCSLIVRLGRVNGIADFRYIAEALFGENVSPSFIDAKVHFPTLCSRTNEIYGAPMAVLHRFTWLGAQTCFGEIALSELRAVEIGDVTLSLSQLTFPEAATVGYCPTCVKNDVELYGVSYWHRVHQLPLVCYCPIHGDSVSKVRVSRSDAHIFFPLPGDLFSDGKAPVQVNDFASSAWRDLADITNMVLCQKEQAEPEVCIKVLERELSYRGLINKKSNAGQWLAWAIENHLGGKDGANGTVLLQLKRSLRGNRRGNALCRAALVYFAFGSWSLFEERCRWESVLGLKKGALPDTDDAGVDSLGDLKAFYRQECLGYLQSHPLGTRHTFLKDKYRSFRWLRRNDRRWLDMQLPLTPNGLQLPLF